nr:hypothetical protein [Tanacetum cinerariifolium]
MSLRYQVTRLKDIETGILLSIWTHPTVEERKKKGYGKNVTEISSDKAKGHRDWNSSEYLDTSNSGGKKEKKAMVFHKIDTEEINDKFVAPCFVNGLEACDGEINLGVEENMISNEFAVKLCLDHEVKRRNKVVKKELIVALRGEIYFVKFIINLEENDVEPGVVFGRSFLRLTKAITDFGTETVTIYPELDPFLEEIETMAYSDKYKEILDGICLDKMKLDGMNKDEEEAIIKIKGETLIEKDDPGAFVILIQLEGKIKLNALVDTGSYINVMPYCIYKELGRECKERDHDVEPLEGRTYGASEKCSMPDGCNNHHSKISYLGHTTGENDDEARSSRTKCFRQYKIVKEVLLPQVHHEFLEWEGCNRDAKSRLGLYHAEELDEEGFDVYFQGVLRSDEHFNAQEYWLSISREENLSLSRSHASTIKNPILRVLHKMITYGLCQRTRGKARVLSDEVLRSLSAMIYCRDMDITTLRELIDSEGRLIPEAPQPYVPKVAIPRAQRASMQDLYERLDSIEIRQGAIERMAYRKSYY